MPRPTPTRPKPTAEPDFEAERDHRQPPPSIEEFPQLRDTKLRALVLRQAAIREQMAELTAAESAIRAQVAETLARAEVDGVMVEHYRVNLVVNSTSTHLSKERLVELGVNPRLIAKATITTVKKPYVSITDTEKRARTAAAKREEKG